MNKLTREQNKLCRHPSIWKYSTFLSPPQAVYGTSPRKRSFILANTALPIEGFGFALHKGQFHDAISLWYNRPPLNTPSTCGSGVKFYVEHALSCPKGGFPSITYNEIMDLTANLLTKVCSDVHIEPDLQPTHVSPGEFLQVPQPITRMIHVWILLPTVSGGSVWKNILYFDVRIFNPQDTSHRKFSPAVCYCKQESLKKCAYAQRVREIEHSSFTPLVLSATGGMANEATTLYKRLASCFAMKWDHPYSSTMSWLRCWLTFTLLHSAI